LQILQSGINNTLLIAVSTEVLYKYAYPLLIYSNMAIFVFAKFVSSLKCKTTLTYIGWPL